MNQSEPKICAVCSSSDTRICPRCTVVFCAHHASKIDMQFCSQCMSAVILEDTIITKEVITKSHSGKKTFRRVMKARRLVFEGQDWMFAQARVTTLSDTELTKTIEYHRVILNGMLNEREVRRIKTNQNNLKKLVASAAESRAKAEKQESAVSQTVTTTKVKKVTTVANPQAAVEGIINMLKAKGLTPEQITATLMGMAAKKA